MISEGIPFTITFCAFDSKGAISTVYDGQDSELVLRFTFSTDDLDLDGTVADGCSTNVIDDETLPYVQLAQLETIVGTEFCWRDSFGSAADDLPFSWFDFGGGDGSDQKSTSFLTVPFITRWSRKIR